MKERKECGGEGGRRKMKESKREVDREYTLLCWYWLFE